MSEEEEGGVKERPCRFKAKRTFRSTRTLTVSPTQGHGLDRSPLLPGACVCLSGCYTEEQRVEGMEGC